MYSRYNADDYTWEIVGSRGEIICKTNTEKEAKELIERSKK